MDDNNDTFEPYNRWIDANGRDPDSYSPTLRRYHQRLWSGRRLPGLTGDKSLKLKPHGYGLIDVALDKTFFELGEPLFLSSDAAIPTWWRWKETERLRAEDPELKARIDDAYWPLYAMGGMLMFPGRSVGRQWTINQAKGCLKTKVADRLDLTVECIRLHYDGEHADERNPLGSTLLRYKGFLDLFGTFSGYIDFWLLQDLVTPDRKRVHFFMEGDLAHYDFTTRYAIPQSAGDYDTYLRNALDFVDNRSERMVAEWQRPEIGPFRDPSV